MPPKRKQPVSRISPSARWDQIYNSAVTILFFSTVNVVLSVVDYQLMAAGSSIWFPLAYILSSLYNKLVAISAMWVFRRRYAASTCSILLIFYLSIIGTLTCIGLVFTTTYALAQRKGTFDYVRTGVTQRRYYQSKTVSCGKKCTTDWVVLMFISCGFFVNGAISIYLNAILKSQYCEARRTDEMMKKHREKTKKREQTLPPLKLNGSLPNGKPKNGHIPNGTVVQKALETPKKAKQLSRIKFISSTPKKRKALSVTTNPYIGFQLGKMITEEYIEAPFNQFDGQNSTVNPNSETAENPDMFSLAQTRFGASLPTITQSTLVEFSPFRFSGDDQNFADEDLIRPGIASFDEYSLAIPRLGSNSSESLTAYFATDQKPETEIVCRSEVPLVEKPNESRKCKYSEPVRPDAPNAETLIDFESPPSVIGSPFSAFSPLDHNSSKRRESVEI
ncbi:uncharacterized protein LOC134852890 isoform X2 [Symsagittifera roscoffensis]